MKTLFLKHRYELAVLFLWVVVVASKLQFNGLILGFDYGTYQPDGKFYTYMALDFLNNNPTLSAQQVVDWYAVHGFKMNTFKIEDLMPSTSYAYPYISHRILYPLLSVPFVAIFGIPGMLVIPSISLLFLLLSILWIAKKFNKPIVGLGIVVVLLNSSTVLRWMIVNCTDSLLVGLFAFVPFLILRLIEKKREAVFLLAGLVVLTSATRFILPIWLGIFFVLFFRKGLRNQTLLLLTTSVLCAIPALEAQLSTALLPAETDTPTYLKLIQLPLVFIKIIVVDFLQFGVLDRPLLMVLVFCLIQAFRIRHQLSAQMFMAVFASGYLIGAINGTLGVNFRYEMPVLIFCGWLIVDSFEYNQKRLGLVSSVAGNIIVNETQEQLKTGDTKYRN